MSARSDFSTRFVGELNETALSTNDESVNDTAVSLEIALQFTHSCTIIQVANVNLTLGFNGRLLHWLFDERGNDFVEMVNLGICFFQYSILMFAL